MDAALELKVKNQEGLVEDFTQAKVFLERSELFKALLSDFDISSINLLHRLIQLSEIPFAKEYDKVKAWRDQLADLTFCVRGFSLSGKEDDILACYNAMITNVLIKLDYPNQIRIQKGIDWIMAYQNVQRNQENHWQGKGIHKYGGCMKSTPCFIGVVKSMDALTSFQKSQEDQTSKLTEKLELGMEYILEHKAYKRQQNNQPITKDITKLTFPFTYKTNVVEILRLLKKNGLENDPRTEDAKAFLRKKKKGSYWKANAVYKSKFWIDFDEAGKKSDWIDFEIKTIIPKPQKP